MCTATTGWSARHKIVSCWLESNPLTELPKNSSLKGNIELLNLAVRLRIVGCRFARDKTIAMETVLQSLRHEE